MATRETVRKAQTRIKRALDLPNRPDVANVVLEAMHLGSGMEGVSIKFEPAITLNEQQREAVAEGIKDVTRRDVTVATNESGRTTHIHVTADSMDQGIGFLANINAEALRQQVQKSAKMSRD